MYQAFPSTGTTYSLGSMSASLSFSQALKIYLWHGSLLPNHSELDLDRTLGEKSPSVSQEDAIRYFFLKIVWRVMPAEEVWRWVMFMAGHSWMKGTAVEVPEPTLVSALSGPCCSVFPGLKDIVTPLSFPWHLVPSFLIWVSLFCWWFVLKAGK